MLILKGLIMAVVLLHLCIAIDDEAWRELRDRELLLDLVAVSVTASEVNPTGVYSVLT